MISPTTPDKLAEIIRDTWPNLYRPPVTMQNLHNDSKCVRLPLQGYVDYSWGSWYTIPRTESRFDAQS